MTYSPPLTSGDADALLGGAEEPMFPDDDCLDGCWNGSLPSPPRRTRSFGPKKETDGGTVFSGMDPRGATAGTAEEAEGERHDC